MKNIIMAFVLLISSASFANSTSKNVVSYRDAKIEDVPQIYAMIKELAQFEKKDVSKLPLTEEKLKNFGFSNTPYFRVIIAENEQHQLLGYALYFFTFRASEGAPILYIEDLYVREHYRNQGIGTKLMATLAQKTIDIGCAYMEWNVFNWNEQAIGFYKKIGSELRKDLFPVRLKADHLKTLALKSD